MSNSLRFNITVRIWIAAILVGSSLGTPPISPAMPAAIGTALIATILIWGGLAIDGIRQRIGTSVNSTPQQTQPQIIDKAYKLAVLLEMMDEDEREDFKHRLKNDLIGNGDDSISLESLITEKQKRG